MTKPAIRLLVVLAASAVCAEQAEAETQDVGHQKQLFADHRFIESSDGITLRMNPPYQTGERLVVVDQPWEQGANIHVYGSVLKEDGPDGPRIRLWYDLYTGKGRPGEGFRGLCYAESRDGIHFEKPILGLVELNLDTSAGGEAFVEIRNLEGNPIDGFSLDDSDHLGGNNVAFPVSWKGSQDVSSLAGEDVNLYFKLRNCKLYAFQFQH